MGSPSRCKWMQIPEDIPTLQLYSQNGVEEHQLHFWFLSSSKRLTSVIWSPPPFSGPVPVGINPTGRLRNPTGFRVTSLEETLSKALLGLQETACWKAYLAARRASHSRTSSLTVLKKNNCPKWEKQNVSACPSPIVCQEFGNSLTAGSHWNWKTSYPNDYKRFTQRLFPY